MTANLEKAKEILHKYNYTCVLYDGAHEYHSNKKGVQPLIDFLNSNIDFSDYCVADKVVGAGAAHLYVLLRVKSIWANLISANAKGILEKNNIPIFFEKEVPHIINRNGDDMCPIERCVEAITDSDVALIAIEKRLKELR